MNSFRPDTSFPFLALARRLGADYGDVLTYADWTVLPVREWTDHHARARRRLNKYQKLDVNQAVEREIERRAIVFGAAVATRELTALRQPPAVGTGGAS